MDQWVTVYLAADPEPLPPDLVQGALTAIDRIIRPPSELLELWEEEDPAQWLTAVLELKERL